MEYAAYMRDQAARYRALAEAAEDPEDQAELRDLARTCEHVASAAEDREGGG